VQLKKTKLEQCYAAGNFAKQALIKDDISALELAAEAAQAEYHRAAERNAQEIVTFRRTQAGEMLGMLRMLARTQVQHAEQSLELWGQAATALSSSRVQPVAGA
jgi:hypothetical protein